MPRPNIWVHNFKHMVHFKSCHPPAGCSVPASLHLSHTHLAPSPHQLPILQTKGSCPHCRRGRRFGFGDSGNSCSFHRAPSILSLYLILRACEQRCHCFCVTEEKREGAERFSPWSKVTKLEAKPKCKVWVMWFSSITLYL